MKTLSLLTAVLLPALLAYAEPGHAIVFSETLVQTHGGDHTTPDPPPPASNPYSGNGVFTKDEGIGETYTHTEQIFTDDIVFGSLPQREEFAFGTADLESAQVHAQIRGVMRVSGLPGGTITLAGAAIGDGVSLGRPGGPPFGTLVGDVVTFTLDISGSATENNPVPGSNFNGSIIGLVIGQPGTITPLLDFESPNWICRFYWGIGSNANVNYSAGGPVRQLPLVGKITSFPATLTASCPSGANFDWAVYIRPSYAAFNTASWDYDFSNTISASLHVPAGVEIESTTSGFVPPGGVPPAADHYLTYKTKATKGSLCAADAPLNANNACVEEEDCGGVSDTGDAFCVPNTFPKGLRVKLADPLEPGPRVFDVKKPLAVCVPADKFGGGIVDPDTHLRSYAIALTKKACAAGSASNEGGACAKEADCGGTKQTTFCQAQAKSVKQPGLLVRNQFHTSESGALRVDAIKPDRLLVPTSKGIGAPLDPPGAFGVNHYKCYTVAIPKGDPKFKVISGVSVDDQFTNGAKLFDLKKPTRLCLPVNKNGEGVLNPTANLLCYQATPVTGQPKHQAVKGLYLSNQLDQEQADTVKEEDLCVPSDVELPGGTPAAG